MRIISTHARSAAALVAAVAALMVALSPIAPPPAAASGIRYSHEIANHVTWEYDGIDPSGIWSSRAAWGDYPLRVQVQPHAPGIAEPGVISVRAVIHPSDLASVVHLEAIEVRVTVTDPDGDERVATMTAASAVIDAAGLILTATVPAGGPGAYTLTGTVGYTVVPAPEPEPTTTPPAPTTPTPPTPTSPPVAQQAATPAQAARPVAAPPAYTG